MSCGTVIGEPWAPWRGPDTLAVGRGRSDPQNIWPCGVGRTEKVQISLHSSPAFLALSAQRLATLLIQHEQLQGVQSPGVLIIFWFLYVVCAIVPFRSKILSAVAKVRGKRGTCQVQPYLSRGWPRGSRSPLGPKLPLPCSQDLPCCSVLSTLSPTCCICAGKQTGEPGERAGVTQGNEAGHGHCGVFTGYRGPFCRHHRHRHVQGLPGVFQRPRIGHMCADAHE